MAESNQTSDSEILWQSTAKRLRMGEPTEIVKGSLVDHGIPAVDADGMIVTCWEALRNESRSRGHSGLAWIAGGALVTAVSYLFAAPGGTYVVTWGAIIYGGIRFHEANELRQRLIRSRGVEFSTKPVVAGSSQPIGPKAVVILFVVGVIILSLFAL